MHKYCQCVINDNYSLGVLTNSIISIFVRNRYGIYDILVMFTFIHHEGSKSTVIVSAQTPVSCAIIHIEHSTEKVKSRFNPTCISCIIIVECGPLLPQEEESKVIKITKISDDQCCHCL